MPNVQSRASNFGKVSKWSFVLICSSKLDLLVLAQSPIFASSCMVFSHVMVALRPPHSYRLVFCTCGNRIRVKVASRGSYCATSHTIQGAFTPIVAGRYSSLSHRQPSRTHRYLYIDDMSCRNVGETNPDVAGLGVWLALHSWNRRTADSEVGIDHHILRISGCGFSRALFLVDATMEMD